MRTKDYPDLKPNCDCRTCLGCGLLERKNFTGKYSCPYWMSAEKEEPYYYGAGYGNND